MKRYIFVILLIGICSTIAHALCPVGVPGPAGHDPGMERVLLLNTLATAVNLDGWALADKNKRRHPLDGITLEAGAVTTVTLPCTTIQRSNQGGIITLLNSAGLKVHIVQYNKNDVSE